MATIRKKGKGWQVLIRKKFAKQIIKTFVSKLDAQKYAREKESQIDKGFLVSYEEAQKTKLSEWLERYRTEITSKKKGKSLTNTQIKTLNKSIDDIGKLKVGPKIKEEVLKLSKNKDNFDKYIKKNWEDVLNYFNDPSIRSNTRSDRKNKAFFNAIIRNISEDAKIDFWENNKQAKQEFIKNFGIASKSDIDPEI